jgi:hypothetical protein
MDIQSFGGPNFFQISASVFKINECVSKVGHTSFKMIYEHYYKYMKKDDPSDKILAYFEQDETKSPEKLVQSGYTDQDVLKNKQ